MLASTTTVLAGLFVVFALLLPIKAGLVTPGRFARIPVEAVILAGLVLILPRRSRRVVAALAGASLGVLVILKALDMGYYEVLVRPFDPVLDAGFVENGIELLTSSYGSLVGFGIVAGIVALAVGAVVLTTLSVMRLSRAVVEHNRRATGAVAVLGTAWVASAALGVHVVPGVPLASKSSLSLAYKHAVKIRTSLRDQREFAKQAAIDKFRNTPGDQLLTGLRGKDVMVTFIESYGRSAIEDPRMAPQVDAVLNDGTRRLQAAGYSARSGWLTSPTAGGGSWLAHATLLSGLWINNQQRYRAVTSSDRLTLNKAFQRASWRSVAVVPGVSRAWPEAKFFGYNKVYDAYHLGYRGPKFGWATMPDQYTLSTFHNLERSKPHAPVMTEIPLLSSHWPWAPIPRMIGWDQLGDGSVFGPIAKAGNTRRKVWSDPGRVRNEYRRSIEYSLNALVSYVEKYGGDNLVLVFLGDHQPMPIVTGDGASRDVPITVVAHDKSVLDKISSWGWTDGLKPDRKAPVWPMSSFRDRFLTAYSADKESPEQQHK